MLNIGWTELLVIGVVAIVVVGPKDLPRLLRTVRQYAIKFRSMTSEVKHHFAEALRETELRMELRDVQTAVDSVRRAADAFKPAIPPRPALTSEPALPTSTVTHPARAVKTSSKAASRGAPRAARSVTSERKAPVSGAPPKNKAP
jgi:sec-independent protein translocase protein TatB